MRPRCTRALDAPLPEPSGEVDHACAAAIAVAGLAPAGAAGARAGAALAALPAGATYCDDASPARRIVAQVPARVSASSQ